MDGARVLKQKVFARLEGLSGPKLLEVLDFVDFLAARRPDGEDPILRVAGCLSGSPLSAEQIERELYGEDSV